MGDHFESVMRIPLPDWTQRRLPVRLIAILTPSLLLIVLLVARVIPLYHPSPTLVYATPDIPNAFRQPLQLSSDPYTNAGSQHATELEPGAYAYGDTIVTAFQMGRFSDGGSSNNGWATSQDDGRTWHSGFLRGTTQFAGGSYTRLSDPVVAYDAAHTTWMISSLAIVGSGSTLATHALIVNLSTDGGLTWSKPYTVIDGGSTFYDKDWITCDTTPTSPYYGHCYMEWDDNDHNGLILMSVSSDGGHTWSKPRTTADAAHGIGGQPLVQSNGTVVVPISSINGTNMLSFLSKDGGLHWSKTVVISPVHNYVLSTAAIDGADTIYVVWVDCMFEKQCINQGGGEDARLQPANPADQQNDLVMSTSTDGVHWSAPRLIPADPLAGGTTHAITGLGIDHNTWGSAAHLALTYYYYPTNCGSSCSYSVGFISSEDGGRHWTTSITLAGPISVAWLPTGRNKLGDYISTVFSNGLAYPFFSIADQPDTSGKMDESIATISGGLNV